MPSINAHGEVKTPPHGPPHQRVPGPYRAYMNYIRRAGCPHPAASSRGSPSTGRHPRRGRRPRHPGNLLLPPIPGTPPPGRACPAPTARRWASPMPSINAHGGVKTPPYGPPHQRVPGPYRAAVGKPHAVHKRPRRGQDPSLRTAPSTSARPPPRGGAGTATKKPRRSLFPGLPRFFI